MLRRAWAGAISPRMPPAVENVRGTAALGTEEPEPCGTGSALPAAAPG
jgi:hypothetical protein